MYMLLWGLMRDPIADIVERIEFRFVKEQDEGRFHPMESVVAPAPWQGADVANTYIRDTETKVFKNPELLAMTRGTTVAMSYLINALVAVMPKDQVFVNVGVWHGYTYISAIVDNPTKRCVGVDHFLEFKDNPGKKEFYALYEKFRTMGSEFFESDFKDYFRKQHIGPIGVYFYDGEHTYEAHMEGLACAAPFFVPGTYIIIDDIDRPQVYKSILDFLALPENLNVYEVALDRKTVHAFHPTWHCGVIVLKKVR